MIIHSCKCNSPHGSIRSLLKRLDYEWEREGDGRITVWSNKGAYVGTYGKNELQYLYNALTEIAAKG